MTFLEARSTRARLTPGPAAIALATVIGLSLSACGSTSDERATPAPPPPMNSATPSPSPSPTPSPSPAPGNTNPNPPQTEILLPANVQREVEAKGSLGGSYAGRHGGSSVQGLREPLLSYNGSSGVYTLTVRDAGGEEVPISFSPSDQAQGPVAGLRYFNLTSQNGETTRVVLYDTMNNIGLSYASFGFSLLPQAGGAPPSIHAALVGIPTTTLPVSGTANYAGTVAGLGTSNSMTYILTGSSSLSADFGAGRYSTSFNFSGTDIAGSGATLAIQNYSGTNSYTLNGSPLNGSLSGSGSGNWQGRFFGPNAEEFGYTFNVSTNTLTAVGVAAGKRQ